MKKTIAFLFLTIISAISCTGCLNNPTPYFSLMEGKCADFVKQYYDILNNPNTYWKLGVFDAERHSNKGFKESWEKTEPGSVEEYIRRTKIMLHTLDEELTPNVIHKFAENSCFNNEGWGAPVGYRRLLKNFTKSDLDYCANIGKKIYTKQCELFFDNRYTKKVKYKKHSSTTRKNANKQLDSYIKNTVLTSKIPAIIKSILSELYEDMRHCTKMPKLDILLSGKCTTEDDIYTYKEFLIYIYAEQGYSNIETSPEVYTPHKLLMLKDDADKCFRTGEILDKSQHNDANFNDIVLNILGNYKRDISNAKSSNDKINAIIKLVSRCMVLHPYKDHNTRTFALLLNRELMKNDLAPALLDDSCVFENLNPSLIKKEIYSGQNNFQRLHALGYTYSYKK